MVDITSLVQIALNSAPTNWTSLGSVPAEEFDELFVLRSNLDISIASGLTTETFREEWVARAGFSAPGASSRYVYLLWQGHRVLRELSISVDGGKCSLPLPDLPTMTVPDSKLQFFVLYNGFTSQIDFMQYFTQAGMTAMAQPWP